MDKLKTVLYTFIIGVCCGITAITLYIVISRNVPFLKAAGVGTGAADINAKYHDGYGTAVATTSTSIYVSDANGYLPDGSVDTGAIVDGTVSDSDLGTISPSKISGTAWTSTNDGDGSGLDADTIAGRQIIYKKYTYCKTSSTYNGNLGGTSGADAKCASGCGSGYVFSGSSGYSATVGASVYEFAAVNSTGWILKEVAHSSTCDDGAAWYLGGISNCGTWTSAASDEIGSKITTSNCTGSNSEGWCNSTARILCVKVE